MAPEVVPDPIAAAEPVVATPVATAVANLGPPIPDAVAVALAIALGVARHGGIGHPPSLRQVEEARRLLGSVMASLRAEASGAVRRDE